MSISDEIIKVLDALAERLGIVIDWTSQNVIPYLEQLYYKYIKYEIATSIVWMLIGIVCILVGKRGIKIVQYFYKKYQEDKSNYCDMWAIIIGLAVGMAFLSGAVIIGSELFDVVTCLTFPEKIILEEIKLLYQNMN
jgi:hypothetical protein